MAWYSLYKWFNSLTEEEQKKEKAMIKGLKEKEIAGLQHACLALSMLVGFYSNRIYQSVQHLPERKAMVKYKGQDLLVFIPGEYLWK